MILPFVREMLSDLENSEPFKHARRHLEANAGRVLVSGLTATARNLHLPYFVRAAGHPVILVVADNKVAEAAELSLRAAAELTGAIDPEDVLRLPAHDVLPFEGLSPHPEILEQRAEVLSRIANGDARLVIAPIEAASMRFFPPEYYAKLARRLRPGEEVDVEELTSYLASVGYDSVDMVEMPGQFARRGGILDLYSPEMERPVRIELFGDEIESMRKFEPDSQRSSTPVSEALLLPLTETPISGELLAAVHARLSGQASGETDRDQNQAGDTSTFPGWEFFAAAAGADRSLYQLFPYVQVFVEEPSQIRSQADRWWAKVIERHERSGIGSLITPETIYFPPEEILPRIQSLPGLDLDQLGAVGKFESDVLKGDLVESPARAAGSPNEIAFTSRPNRRLHGSIPDLMEELKAAAAKDMRILVSAPNQGEVERLASLFREYGQPYRLGSRIQHVGSENIFDETSYLAGDFRTPVVVRSRISTGVTLPESRIMLLGSGDIADEAKQEELPAAKRAKSKTSAFVSDFRDLGVGDYVVHVEHGIARYQGLKEIDQEGVKLEFMVLEFAEQARLYVPLTRLDLIQKYRSTDAGPAPVLSRLGGHQWSRTKARVRKAMQDMADELLKLYAERKAAAGHAFPSDNEFQREFEDAFDYSETEDQASAITDVKRDMESEMPMDRLLVGDVGYGKTEVAMRAAFKAVQDGKQVAVLTPTTVLAFQHFETFKSRFKQFPINIEMISRLRSAREQKRIMEQVETGKVDILIGTHRLLSKDIHFHNLGLLVVDEEQRFGVRHKERLKQMRREIDVLSMSATPIPRTLHMSLAGLRDMSVIETPPKDRMAIQTIVARYDEKLLRTAIELELERGGQVYYVHNRVETIYEIAAKIQEMVPAARVAVGHGQMSEGELERVMLAFMRHEYDVLVATTIIENGLDIPLANTIIIGRADRHGLSELYQLRGRVGRSNRRAYAYLLVPAEQDLTDVARRRLAALKEFSDLGAGFKIAALDLELRGAGNMLGGEQSGHIEAVGFEMYTSMLEQAVNEIKGQEQPERLQVQLNLGVGLRIDESYIPEENQRLRMYKRIAGVAGESALGDVRAELEDRYGPLPPAAAHLLDAAALRLECERLGVAQVDRKRDQLLIRFTEQASVDPGRLMKMVARNAKKGAQLSPQGVLRLPLKATEPDGIFAEIRSVLEALSLRSESDVVLHH